MLQNVSHKVAIRNFKLARPRQLPTCPNGHGTLVPAHAFFGCIDCGHTQPRTPSTRTALPTEATDLTHHLRQADAPSEETNEKDNPGPAGDTGDRGRAVPDSENPTRVDKLLKQWIEDDKILDRERWRRGRWS